MIKKVGMLFILLFMSSCLVGCKEQSFDDYIKDKGFESAFDTIGNGNAACALARKKGRDCEDIPYPEHNYYSNDYDDMVIYSEEDGISLGGKNYIYFPLKNTFYWYSSDLENQVMYDTKTKKCTNKDNNNCSEFELEQVSNMYKNKGHYLDDFKGNLEDVEF